MSATIVASGTEILKKIVVADLDRAAAA